MVKAFFGSQIALESTSTRDGQKAFFGGHTIALKCDNSSFKRASQP